MRKLDGPPAAGAQRMKRDLALPTPNYQRPTFDKTTKGLLQDAVATFPANRGTAICKIQRLRRSDPAGTSRAVLELLQVAEINSRLLEDAVGLLTTCSLLAELFISSHVWPLDAAVALALKIRSVEPRLDVRLVKQVLGNAEDVGSIDGDHALRLLGLIDAISDCSVLASYLVQFQRHPSDRVRSKAVLMLGRSNCNPGRVERLLSSGDDRMRANAVESLWGQRSKAARQILWRASQDRCARVVANALLGLCRAGEDDAFVRLGELAWNADPTMRCSGAWAMGETGDLQFLAMLEKLAQDPVATVRERAEKSRQKLAAKIPVAPVIPPKEPKPEPEPTPVADTKDETREDVESQSVETEVSEPVEEKAPESENGWLTGRRTDYVRIA